MYNMYLAQLTGYNKERYKKTI